MKEMTKTLGWLTKKQINALSDYVNVVYKSGTIESNKLSKMFESEDIPYISKNKLYLSKDYHINTKLLEIFSSKDDATSYQIMRKLKLVLNIREDVKISKRNVLPKPILSDEVLDEIKIIFNDIKKKFSLDTALTINYDPRLTKCCGKYIINKNVIELAANAIIKYDINIIKNIIAHELAHALEHVNHGKCGNHGKEFRDSVKQVLLSINASNEDILNFSKSCFIGSTKILK